MTAVAGTRAPHTGGAFADGRLTLADAGGAAVLVCYITIKFGPFEQLWFSPGIVSTAFLPALAIGVLAITPGIALQRAPINMLLLGMLAWSTMSVSWSVDQTFTLFLIRSELPALVLTLLVVASMRLEVVTGTLIAYLQVIMAWSFLTSLGRPESRRSMSDDFIPLIGWRGTFDHKNGMGMFLVLGLATVIAFEHRRVVRPVMITLCVVGTFATRSATAASGLLVMVLVALWVSALSVSRNRRDQAIFAILSVMIAALAVFLTLGLLPSFLTLYGKDLTFSGRTIIWANTIDAIADRPWFGIGFTSNWSSVSTPVVLDLRRAIGFDAAHAHNGALELVFEVGIVGLALYLAFFVSVVRRGLRSLTTANPYGRWALATCAALAIMSVSEVLFQGAFLGYLAIVGIVTTRADLDARRSTAVRRM
ncbi:MAG: O-antigen ligase family protein [Actinomycetota bacterium]